MTRVTVVIPSYNRGRVLAESVASVLAQTVPPHEVIVVDDGSTDDTPAVCATLPAAVRSIRKPNGGVSSARNVGIAAATGDWIALLDADDVWPPNKLEIQLAALAASPEAGWSITNHRTTDLAGTMLPGRQGFVRDFPAFDDAGQDPDSFFSRTMRRTSVRVAGQDHVVYTGDAWPLLFFGNVVFPSCAIVRREVAAKAGPWDETFRVANDTEWFHRVSSVAPAVVVMTPLMSWRRGQGNTLMQGRNIVSLLRNAITSLDRALKLRPDPSAEVRATWRFKRDRLLLRLAYGHLSVLDPSGAAEALGEARASGTPVSARWLLLRGASLLPVPALRGLHAVKRALASMISPNR